MTVLGGVAGSADDPRRVVSAILAGQHIYAHGPPEIEVSEHATFGASGARYLAVNPRWLLVADARLDNALELAKAVGIESPQSTSMTEILLAAWDKWGEDCFQYVLGDFALAIYDREIRSLTLARDATGQRPLFYKSTNGTTAFASMPSGLVQIFQQSGPNLAVLARHQANLLQADSQSFFTGIERVMPGEVVRFTGGNVDRRLHWQPTIHPERDDGTRDYVGAYRQLLDTAVGSRIPEGNDAFGCHLSSGYDSSAVTGTAARLVDPARLTAFTSAPLSGSDAQVIRHRFSDESSLAAETVRMHGIRHVIIRETEPLFDVIERQVELFQSPQFNPFNMIWWTEIRRRATELGIDTILTGEIGNLTLNASGLRTLSALVASGQWRRWWREASLGVQRSDIRWRGVLVTSFQPWLPLGVWRRLRQAVLGIPPAEELSFLQRHWYERLRPELDAPLATGDPYQDRLDLIRLVDPGAHRKAAAADGIEELDPMSDRRLIEFSLQLPYEKLFQDGQPRPLARAALRDRVPASVLDMQIRGLQGTDWHLRISQQMAREVLERIGPHPLVGDLLDLAKLRAAIEKWPSGDWNSYPILRKYRDGVTGALATGLFLICFGANCGRA